MKRTKILPKRKRLVTKRVKNLYKQLMLHSQEEEVEEEEKEVVVEGEVEVEVEGERLFDLNE